MLLLYTTLLFVLGAIKLLLGRKVAGLERKHATLARAADRLVRETTFREGNTSRPDAFQNARRVYALGQVVQKQDRLEARYETWQGTYDRFARLVSRLRGWKGKTLPYTFGAVDVVGVLVLIDLLGFGDVVSPRSLIQLITSLVGGG
jgi:hypothetical protein